MNEKQIKLIPDGCGCYVSHRILLDGKRVGFMYREAVESEKKFDSGWRFFSGEEDQAYVDDPDNLSICSLNTVASYDQTIIPYLDAPVGIAFGRIAGSDKFEEEDYEPSDW